MSVDELFRGLICALIRYIQFLKVPTHTLGFMNVILLRGIITPQFSVEWFRYIIIVFVFLFSPPWRWPHEWPKHVDGCYVVKLCSYNQVHLLVPFKSLYMFLDSLLRETTDSSTHVREYFGDCRTSCSGLLLSSQYPEAAAIGRFATSFFLLFSFPLAVVAFQANAETFSKFQIGTACITCGSAKLIRQNLTSCSEGHQTVPRH